MWRDFKSDAPNLKPFFLSCITICFYSLNLPNCMIRFSFFWMIGNYIFLLNEKHMLAFASNCILLPGRRLWYLLNTRFMILFRITRILHVYSLTLLCYYTMHSKCKFWAKESTNAFQLFLCGWKLANPLTSSSLNYLYEDIPWYKLSGLLLSGLLLVIETNEPWNCDCD